MVILYAVTVGLAAGILALEWFCKLQANQRLHWACVGLIARVHHLLGYAIPFAAGFELLNGSVFSMRIVAFLMVVLEIAFGFLLWMRAGVKANDPTQQLSLADTADRIQYGYFFIGLKNDKRYFFLLDYYRRIIVGGAFVVLISTPIAQLIAISLIEFVYFLLLKNSKPMQDITLQSTQEYSSFVRAGVPLIALVAVNTVAGSVSGIPMAISILLLLVFICIFLVILISLVRLGMSAAAFNEEDKVPVDLDKQSARNDHAAFLKESRHSLLKKSFDPVRENELPAADDEERPMGVSRQKLYSSMQSNQSNQTVGSGGSSKKKVMMIDEDEEDDNNDNQSEASQPVEDYDAEAPEEPRDSLASTVLSDRTMTTVKAKPKPKRTGQQ
jgi:hypothetical protein